MSVPANFDISLNVMAQNKAITTLQKLAVCSLYLFTILFVSCTDTGKKAPAVVSTPAPQFSKPGSSYADTLIINARAAVFFSPDSLQLIKMSNAYDKMIFDSRNHECTYQMKNAQRVLASHWPNVRIIQAKKSRFLLFINQENNIFIDLDSNEDMCGVYLFEPGKKPVLADMTNIDTAISFYFTE